LCRAQDRGQVGVTMGIPAAAGMTWHITNRIAVRPDITFTQSTSKVDASLPNVSTSRTTRALGIGASLVWYFGSADAHVRPYVSPRVAYAKLSSDDEDEDLGFDVDEIPGTLTVSGSVGVQYTPVRRFGVYGEVGFARAHSERTMSFPSITATVSTTTWSTRGAVGVILYLGR
jgi:outer membrane protein W